MIRITDQYFWNIIFILFYVGLLTMAGIILNTEARMAYEDLSLLDLAIISLASFRFTRLFVYDNMTKFLREQFWDVKTVRNKIMLVKPITGPRRTLADLVGCPWCFGVWATTCVAFFYLLTSYAYFPILILALSGVATMLQLFANMVGWKAEQLKRETEAE